MRKNHRLRQVYCYACRLEKEIVLAILLSGFLFHLEPVLGQDTSRVSSYVSSAEKRVQEGDYRTAMYLYRQAVNLVSSQSKKVQIQEALDEVTRRYYAQLYEQVQAAETREEKIKLLVQARSLDLRGWLFTDFEEIVFAVRSAIEEIFRQLLSEADRAIQQENYATAVSRYEQARELDPTLFEEENLGASLAELKDRVRLGERLARDGQSLLSRRRYEEAREKFQQANVLHPGQPAVEQGLKEVNSILLLHQGRKHAAAGQYVKAENVFRRSLQIDPENTEAARLLERSENYREHVYDARILYQQGQCEEAQDEFRKARDLNPTRFVRDRLESVLNDDCSQALPLPFLETRGALLALFEGRTQDAIETLRQLIDGVGKGDVRLLAFLGAAYCHSAFMYAQPDESALESAKEQFHRVLDLRPDYQLSRKLFSPRIHEVFEQVRSEMDRKPGG